MKYFVEMKDKFNFTYSLDMIRLNFNFINSVSFDNLINSYYLKSGFSIRCYISRGVGYHYLYAINIENQDGDKCSFSIGVGLNCLTENNKSGYIEFNPNKCFQLIDFIDFFNKFYDLLRSCKLVRYDLAIDIPVSRNKIKMIRNSRCNYKYLVSKDDWVSTDLNYSKTEYQGRRNHNKFTKLYDKKAESHLPYDLSRIEITFNRNEIEYKNLPEFYLYHSSIINDLDFSILSSTELVLVDLLRNSEDIDYYLANIGYRLRKKIKPFLSDYVLKFDFDIFRKIRILALQFEK